MAKSLYKDSCDKVRFSNVYDKNAQSLTNLLKYKFGSTLSPAHIMQDAFIKLWEKCSKVTTETAKSYVYKIANNRMLNAYKHQKVVLKYQ